MTAQAFVPTPVTRRPREPYVRVRELERDLAARVDGEVRFDPGTRGAYSTDGSNYRQVPIGVVVPRSVEAAAEAVAVCREHRAPVTSRGGGTSLAGQTCNAAVVIDWSKYCHRLVSVDRAAHTCVVEPGIVLDTLNLLLRDTGLMFGPRPSTHSHCTLGGMIGNNSCGSTAQAYGKTADNVARLEILTYDGLRTWVGPTGGDEFERILAEGGRRAEIYRGLRDVVGAHAGEIRRRFPDIPRRVSGYNLDQLLPGGDFDLARALVGSEGTLVTVLRAELRLVPAPKAESLVVLGYHDIAVAGDAVPRIAAHRPLQLEGVDDKLVGYERRKGMHPEALKELPEGGGWLMVSFGGDSQEETDDRANALVDDLRGSDHEPHVAFFDTERLEKELWEVRESGLGATARVPGMRETWEGWEDSAVPPERLGDYLRDLYRLFEEFGYGDASLYGHFGQGCVHTRIPFDLVTADGVRAFRAFLDRAADLVVSYGGSLSGEHGDGQSRGELLPRMFGPAVMTAFEQVKAVFDPDDRMNPGKIVAPYRLDENLRLGPGWTPAEPDARFGYPADEGSFQRAVMRCVGVGQCRRPSGGVMCPSYRATREEEHSTRGRARLLFEMLDGHADSTVRDGWRSEAVRDALDLCLACKGCSHDCPMEVDMATYKAEFLSHHYSGRVRPAAHYSMGWLPVLARLAAFAPRAVNVLTHTPGLGALAKRAGGIEPARPVPYFADLRFSDWYRRRGPRGDGERGTVVLWPDTFTDNLTPHIGRAAVAVLESAGYRVVLPPRTLCCGLTWISTGQLGVAERVLRRTLRTLAPALRRGTPIVALEPSCAAVFRSDAANLLPHDRDAVRLKEQTRTLAELLTRTDGWRPPRIDRDAVSQPHCHHHSVLGYDTDRHLLRDAGVRLDAVGGCCGLAGDFGFTAGHLDVSLACAESELLPAVRDAGPETLILADGFSCRTQIENAGTGRQALHLAELLASAIRGDDLGPYPERRIARRPGRPQVLGQR
ncbi:FAD-binding and (Fe-S)-binding domain-containing protein [Microbispora sp. ATCC PTA-5024]|uniref:FAD-binding and (Fe-S)-binding domain-containing protein n=1 Tax=Microbispora sp. ATCC PTA-5024 TaxID=316330 RepID=UPI0003DBA6E8|nr:FAD-binding and (Fe-S)-binding domain-containing protein [Microbispora sp. ATCC PTA-5024]ETK37123.1 dimethylmenaquinone methyltransferase [Microbispora sp. ATCC PTA-5024]